MSLVINCTAVLNSGTDLNQNNLNEIGMSISLIAYISKTIIARRDFLRRGDLEVFISVSMQYAN